jgi:hypothetical protein
MQSKLEERYSLDFKRQRVKTARLKLRKRLKEAAASIGALHKELVTAYGELSQGQQDHGVGPRTLDRLVSVERAMKAMREAAKDLGSREKPMPPP